MATNGHVQEVPKPKSLSERLHDKEAIICAEGYLLSFERRGYLQAGPFVPEVVLGRPDLVRLQYEEFVHAGSDVVVAFTYYTNRARLKHIGKEDQLEAINRYALRLAKGVAVQTGTLMAGNICDTSLFVPNNSDSKEAVKAIFREQVGWAVQEGADYVIGETFGHVGEAILATEVIKEAGLPAVVTLRVTNQFFVDGKLATFDGIELGQALQMLENAGADVVGFNCSTGPRTMVSLLAQYRKCVEVPFAALPVGFRTNEKEVTYQDLTDPLTGQKAFPDNLDSVMCSRNEIAEFGRQCAQLGVQYLGICCGNNAGFTRALSESIGRLPPASRFRPDMSKYVSDLHRRLTYLQKVKEMEEEQARVNDNANDETEHDDVNGKENGKDQTKTAVNDEENFKAADDDKGTKPIETNDADEKDTEDQQSVPDISEPNVSDPEQPLESNEDQATDKEAEKISNDKTVYIDLSNIRQESPGASNEAFTMRLPPPPDSKRNRSSPSPTTSENNESEIRLPPPPGSAVKRKDSRIRRRRVSSSSDDDDDEKEIRLPPPPGSSSPRLSSGRRSTGSRSTGSRSPASGSHSPALDETDEPKPVVNIETILGAVKVAIKDSTKNDGAFNGETSRLDLPNISQQMPPTEQPTQQAKEQVVDPIVAENAETSQSKPEHQPLLATGAEFLVDFGADDTQTQQTASVSQNPSINVVADVPKKEESSEWANFSTPKADDTSSISSADEDQIGYSRLEKDEEQEETSQPGWAAFTLSTASDKDTSKNTSLSKDNVVDSVNWATFQPNKPTDEPLSSTDDWAAFDTSRDTGGSIVITSGKSGEVETGDLIGAAKPVESGSTGNLISVAEPADLMSVAEPVGPDSSGYLFCVAEAVAGDSAQPKGNISIDFGDEYEDSEA